MLFKTTRDSNRNFTIKIDTSWLVFHGIRIFATLGTRGPRGDWGGERRKGPLVTRVANLTFASRLC
jgi:hypothetical protein